MRLTLVRPGRKLCVPHTQGLEPHYHYDGCDACAEARSAGNGKSEPLPTAARAGRLATLGELASARSSTKNHAILTRPCRSTSTSRT